MAFCDCGSATSRLKKPTVAGKWVCPECSPDDFPPEKLTAPSDKKVWQGYQTNPERYRKSEGKQGETIYRATDSELQDMEEWACREDEDEKEKERLALEARRAYCREKNQRAETPEEAERNAEAARRLMRQIEAEVALENMGVILPEG